MQASWQRGTIGHDLVALLGPLRRRLWWREGARLVLLTACLALAVLLALATLSVLGLAPAPSGGPAAPAQSARHRALRRPYRGPGGARRHGRRDAAGRAGRARRSGDDPACRHGGARAPPASRSGGPAGYYPPRGGAGRGPGCS